jgi:hypothetical protein
MAARTRKIFHDEDTRNRIRAAAIIDRLQAFVLGDKPDAMSRTQVAAATALLNKVLPDLQSAEVKSEETRAYVIRAPEPSASGSAIMRRSTYLRPGFSRRPLARLPKRDLDCVGDWPRRDPEIDPSHLGIRLAAGCCSRPIAC